MFSTRAWEQYAQWAMTDRRGLKRINVLIADIQRNPDDGNGTGKPEMLKGALKDWRSRRITEEHRLVYRASGDVLEIARVYGHHTDR
ncbi:Txe/YoeB family addiction module toxin [Streptomyces finlayi]|nr:Txe/YoeB family addiction module toxin [Streptomyces finlayi]